MRITHKNNKAFYFKNDVPLLVDLSTVLTVLFNLTHLHTYDICSGYGIVMLKFHRNVL